MSALASLISHFTTMRSPAKKVVEVGVAVQFWFATLVPSSVPCSVLRKAASSLVVYRCTVTCMPAFAVTFDSWLQVLRTTGPVIVTSAASGGEIHWSRVPPEVFVHWPQLPWLGAVLVIRAHGDPSDLGKAVQAAISSVDKTVPALPVQTVEAMLNDQVAEPRLYVILLGTFAGAALLVAMMGIYGLLNYVVSRRLHEMAIRIAIGAQARDVVRSVVGDGLRLSIAGIGCGLAGTVALTRLMKGLLFNVTPTDPLTLGVVTCVLLAVAVAASYLPARRATMADSLMALRHE